MDTYIFSIPVILKLALIMVAAFLAILFVYSYIKKFFLKFTIFIVSTFLYSFWIVSSVLSVFNIAKDTPCGSYFASDTLYSCYIAVLVGVITVFFAVFAFIKPTKMTFKDYQKFVLSLQSKVFYFSILFVFFVNTILIFIHIDNVFFRLAITSSIFLLVIALGKSIYELNCLENEETASKLFVNKIYSAIKKNDKKADVEELSLNLFKSYLLPCFEANCFHVAFHNSADILNSLLSEEEKQQDSKWYYDFSTSTIDIYQWYLEDYLRKPLSKEQRCELINTTMNWIVESNLYNILKNHKTKSETEMQQTISISARLYEIWFKLYRLLLVTDINNIQFPFILNGVEPLSFGIIAFEQDNKVIPSEYINLYKEYLKYAYQICSIALYHSNYLVFRRFLQDYINTVQYLNLESKFSEIIETHNHYLLIIATQIANLLQEDRLTDDFKRLLPSVMLELKHIQICYDYVLYDEPLSLTGVQTVSKDFRYYFVLLMLYSLSKIHKVQDKKTFITKIIDKIESKIDKHVFETLSYTLDNMEDIEDFDSSDKTLLQEKFHEKKEKTKNDEFNELENNLIKIPEIIMRKTLENDIQVYMKHFNYCNIYKNEQCKPIPLPTGFAFVHSGKYLTRQSSYDIFGTLSQLNFIDPFLYNAYINNSEVKIISSIDELLEDNKNLKELTLVCPIKYNMYIRTLKNIQFEGRDIVYKGVKISIVINRENDEYIIVRDNIKSNIFMEKLNVDTLLQGKYFNKDKENTSIDVYFPFIPRFYLKKDSSMEVYSIIGIKSERL